MDYRLPSYNKFAHVWKLSSLSIVHTYSLDGRCIIARTGPHTMNMQDTKQYSFSTFWLDIEKRQLLHRNQQVILTRKALDTLSVLVSNAGRVVSREELKRLVWGDALVEEATIAQNIFTLRKTLGEHEAGQNLIETIAGVGYRFTGQVHPYFSEASPLRLGVAESRRPLSVSKFQVRLRWIVPVLVLGLGLVAAIWWRYAPRHAPRIQSLAVLPFANLTGDPQQEYVADGISDALLTDVAQIPGLRVISGSSAARNATTNLDRKIPQDLQVDALVEGAVLEDGDQLAVDVRLVHAADYHTLWTARFELSHHDLLGLNYTISRSLSRQLQLPGSEHFVTSQSSVGTGNVEAYNEYLKGRFFWNKRTENAFVKAIAYFNHAIALDPRYAQAYAGLADSYALLGSLPNAEMPRSQAMPKAKAAALQALRIDDSLAEAHTSLAFVNMHYDWDWSGSEKEFKRALALNPNYATAHQWYAVWLMAQGKTAASLEEERRAQRADPLSIIIMTDTAQLLIYAGRHDEATKQAQRVLEIDAAFPLAHLYLAVAYIEKKDYPAATTEFQKVLAINKEDPWALSGLAQAYVLVGQRGKSEAILRDLLQRARSQEDLTIELAKVYAQLGENDRAFAWLEKAYRNRTGSLILLNPVPDFQTLHHDPRFADLDRRIGLPLPDERQ
jgi:DNA-binding winged helix-turn-helix (wHTH) protein/TolB-like protein/Tfp pilus assembly protein PilF